MDNNLRFSKVKREFKQVLDSNELEELIKYVSPGAEAYDGEKLMNYFIDEMGQWPAPSYQYVDADLNVKESPTPISATITLKP